MRAGVPGGSQRLLNVGEDRQHLVQPGELKDSPGGRGSDGQAQLPAVRHGQLMSAGEGVDSLESQKFVPVMSAVMTSGRSAATAASRLPTPAELVTSISTGRATTACRPVQRTAP